MIIPHVLIPESNSEVSLYSPECTEKLRVAS